MSLYFSCGRGFMRDVVASYNQASDKPISMKELDFHYLNKVAEFWDYAKEPEYADKKDKFEKMFAEKIEDYKKDKKQEINDTELEKVRKKLAKKNNVTAEPEHKENISAVTITESFKAIKSKLSEKNSY